LGAIARTSGIGLVVVRTPLVYGPGVGGNFIKMLDLTRSGLPLPLGSVRNHRTMVSIWNLTDLLEKSVVESAAVGALILAGDAFSPSTADLLRQLAKSMGRPSSVFAFPVGLLYFAGRVTGRSGLIDRLAGSLEVEAGSSSNGWKWVPHYAFANSIDRTVEWYLSKPKVRVSSAIESTSAQVDTRVPRGKSKK
jgi:nucleoside-diphosphate-sugar epimerase